VHILCHAHHGTPHCKTSNSQLRHYIWLSPSERGVLKTTTTTNYVFWEGKGLLCMCPTSLYCEEG
jgi:hypothetical protein